MADCVGSLEVYEGIIWAVQNEDSEGSSIQVYINVAYCPANCSARVVLASASALFGSIAEPAIV